MEPRDVFISYVQEDGPLARALAQELRNRGYSTWLYEEDGIAGISYLLQVHDAIDASQFFILLASLKSVQSHQVIREVEHAHESEKLIVPVRVGLTHQQFVTSSAILRMACGTGVTLAASTDPSELAKRIVPTFRFTAERGREAGPQETKFESAMPAVLHKVERAEPERPIVAGPTASRGKEAPRHDEMVVGSASDVPIAAAKADASLSVVSTGPYSVEIDSRPLLGKHGRLWDARCDQGTTVRQFLDDVWYEMRRYVHANRYRDGWVLRDSLTGQIFDNVGPYWARRQSVSEDERPLAAVGIRPGSHLEVIAGPESSTVFKDGPIAS